MSAALRVRNQEELRPGELPGPPGVLDPCYRLHSAGKAEVFCDLKTPPPPMSRNTIYWVLNLVPDTLPSAWMLEPDYLCLNFGSATY